MLQSLHKPNLAEEMGKLWELQYARFGPGITLLLDASPYTAVMNPDRTAIQTKEYSRGTQRGEALLEKTNCRGC